MHSSPSARRQACFPAEQVHPATRRLTNTQFALEELRAIVEEAEACGTYVCGEQRLLPLPNSPGCCSSSSSEPHCAVLPFQLVLSTGCAIPNLQANPCLSSGPRSPCLHCGRHHTSGGVWGALD